MPVNCKLRDPFPDQILPFHYPQDPSVPKPRLLPRLEKLLYDDSQDRTMKNSHPWWVEFQLRRCGVLPEEDVVRHMIFTNKLIMADKLNRGPIPLQLPDVMSAFLEELIAGTSAVELKSRWGQHYTLIRNYFDFIQYRLRARDIVFKRHNVGIQHGLSAECRTLVGLLAPVPAEPAMAAALMANTTDKHISNVVPLTFEAERAA